MSPVGTSLQEPGFRLPASLPPWLWGVHCPACSGGFCTGAFSSAMEVGAEGPGALATKVPGSLYSWVIMKLKFLPELIPCHNLKYNNHNVHPWVCPVAVVSEAP